MKSVPFPFPTGRQHSVSLLLFIGTVWVVFVTIWDFLVDKRAESVPGVYDSEMIVSGTNILRSQSFSMDHMQERFQYNTQHASEQIEMLEHKTLQNINETKEILIKLQLETEKLRMRSDQIVKHLADLSRWKPLKDRSKLTVRGFISEIISREKEQGPPELFQFPSAVSNGRHLCLMGNNTSDGTLNSYMLAWEEALPKGHILLNGTTLIAETNFDHINPWHSMFNSFQFLYWRFQNGCADADRLILFHCSELRRTMGNWITQVFAAVGLPAVPEQMAIGDRPICFQKAIVSRLGMGGVPTMIHRENLAQARCFVRTHCNLPVTRVATNSSSVNITLFLRGPGRQWKDQKAWEKVIEEQCVGVENCKWSSMFLPNATFCEQVKRMTETDILLSVHGAQLTNMIFMSPGGRVMEVFPKGWKELAGVGQFVYRTLAKWNGLVHEGYWHDDDQPDCPDKSDRAKCFSFYKNQDVGINKIYISDWLSRVLKNFKNSTASSMDSGTPEMDTRGDLKVCDCMPMQSEWYQ